MGSWVGHLEVRQEAEHEAERLGCEGEVAREDLLEPRRLWPHRTRTQHLHMVMMHMCTCMCAWCICACMRVRARVHAYVLALHRLWPHHAMHMHRAPARTPCICT